MRTAASGADRPTARRQFDRVHVPVHGNVQTQIQIVDPFGVPSVSSVELALGPMNLGQKVGGVDGAGAFGLLPVGHHRKRDDHQRHRCGRRDIEPRPPTAPTASRHVRSVIRCGERTRRPAAVGNIRSGQSDKPGFWVKCREGGERHDRTVGWPRANGVGRRRRADKEGRWSPTN